MFRVYVLLSILFTLSAKNSSIYASDTSDIYDPLQNVTDTLQVVNLTQRNWHLREAWSNILIILLFTMHAVAYMHLPNYAK